MFFDNESAGHLDNTDFSFDSHRRQVKGIFDAESGSSQIPSSLFLFCDTNNTTAQRGDDNAHGYNNFKKKHNTRKRPGSKPLQTFDYIKPTKDHSNLTRKRRRRSWDNHQDYRPVSLCNPKNCFRRPLRNQHHDKTRCTSFTVSSSPRHHQSKVIMSPQTSINSLCSTSASSLSTLHHDDVILKQREQNSYTTESDIEEKKPQGALVEAIGGRFQKRLEGTRLCPSIHGIQSLSSDDLAPSYPFILGVGTFAQVTRVVLKLGNDATKNSYNKRYACKQLKQNLQSNPNEFVKSATELAYEAFILSCFDHPNIIKLRGLSEDGISSFGSDTAKGEEEDHRVASACVGSPPSSSFFLIMDVLEETLDQRIERWKTIARPRSLTETRQRAIEKLSLCQQLANVLEYIHSKGVVYRDLKPQNIGFSEKEGGILKLFDFGLSRELPDSIADASSATFGKEKPTNPNEHVRFKLSGVVGTIRYMAPEVCLSQPYNRDCDIYSWSIVAWEIWSETKPFEEFTPELYEDLVCKQGFRPTDDESAKRIPYELECLLKEAWKLEPHQRIRWPAIQRRLAVFQKCEELSLRESMRAEAAASIPATIAINGRHSMGMMNIPLFHTSIHGLLGGVDVAVNSPCTNSNIIGCSAFSAGSHSITDKNFIFGGSPLRMIGPIRSMPIVLRTGDQDIRSTAKWNHCFNHPPQLS